MDLSSLQTHHSQTTKTPDVLPTDISRHQSPMTPDTERSLYHAHTSSISNCNNHAQQQFVGQYDQIPLDVLIPPADQTLLLTDPWDEIHAHELQCLGTRPTDAHGSFNQMNHDITNYTHKCVKIYDLVRSTGRHNYLEARIPVPSGMNIAAWRTLLHDYSDYQLCDFLEFGWPVNYSLPHPPQGRQQNHNTANAYPSHVRQYLCDEINTGAILGPFSTPPFTPWFNCSPLLTRPKKHSDKRRIIQDHSWPPGASVNYGVPSMTYLDKPYKLRLPSVDTLVALIKKHGPGSYLYGTDLSRAYKQLRSCPLDWPLLGIYFDGQWFCDISISFGLRWGAMACQRLTEAICFITKKEGHDNISYIDDFAGVAGAETHAHAGLQSLQYTMQTLGVSEATNKTSYPATKMLWIGFWFDTIKMEVRIPEDKIDEVRTLLLQWRGKQKASRKQIQRLLGKLFYISQCCKPARLFVSRMLDTLREAPHQGMVTLSTDFQKDVSWFVDLMPSYNGIHLLQPSPPDVTAAVDSCLTGIGGLCGTTFYATQIPQFVQEEYHPIHHLEMLNIVIAVKLWSADWEHKVVRILCDNAAAVAVLQHGRSRDPFLLACARDIWFETAIRDINLLPQHAPGNTLVTVDALSRAHMDRAADSIKQSLINQGYTEMPIDAYRFKVTTRDML